MTRLTFFKNGEHFIGFSCKDHSGYAEEGYDIVCAAVSASVQMTASYFSKYFGNETVLTVDETNALIELKCIRRFTEFDRHLLILEDFAVQISKQFPDYFTFDYLEV